MKWFLYLFCSRLHFSLWTPSLFLSRTWARSMSCPECLQVVVTRSKSVCWRFCNYVPLTYQLAGMRIRKKSISALDLPLPYLSLYTFVSTPETVHLLLGLNFRQIQSIDNVKTVLGQIKLNIFFRAQPQTPSIQPIIKPWKSTLVFLSGKTSLTFGPRLIAFVAWTLVSD